MQYICFGFVGINRQVKYGLKDDANGHFTLDEESGVITLVKSLDREIKDMHMLMVEAYDMVGVSFTCLIFHVCF